MNNLSYETAKKLKEADFPMPKSVFPRERVYEDNDEDFGDYALVPTLTELIEAIIGDRPNNFSLEHNPEWAVYEEPNEDGPWAARYYDLTPVGFYENGAKTPEEAVANLYLALHNK